MMPTIAVTLEGDDAWPDLNPAYRTREVVALPEATWHLAALEQGMASGEPSLALRLDLDRAGDIPGDAVIITETSLAAWISATCALRGRFPEAFQGTPLEAR